MELISESPWRQTEKEESPPALTASAHIAALLNTKAIILHFRPLKLRAEQSGWVQENNTGKGQENMTWIRKMIHRGCNIFQMFAVDPKLARVTAGQFWRKQRTQRSQLQHTAGGRGRELTVDSMARRYLAHSWWPLYSARSAGVSPSTSLSAGFAWLANRILQHWREERGWLRNSRIDS